MIPLPPDRLDAARPAHGRASGTRAALRAIGLGVAVLAVAIAGCARPVSTSPASIGATASPGVPAASVASRTASAAALPTIAPTPTPSVDPTRPAATRSATPTGAAAGPELLLLANGENAVALFLVRLSGEVVPLPLPDPSVAAVAPVANGKLVALLRDGRAFVAPRGPAGLLAGAGWRALALTGAGSMPPGTMVSAATSSPDGTRLVAIARPPDALLPSALVVIEPGRGRRDIRPLANETDGVPPAWIDNARVAIVQRDRLDRTFLAIVAVATGRVTDRLAVRVLDFGTSRDSRTAVGVTHDRIVVGPTASVLELRRAPDTGPATPPDDFVRGGVALSSDGHYLAAAIEEDDSGRSRLAIYEQTDGSWRATIRIAPPAGTSGGWVTWLP